MVDAESGEGRRQTQAQRHRELKRLVALCVADDMPRETIAAVVGIDLAKLEVCFGHELAHGKAIIRAEELMRLDAQSGDGKTAATKALLENADTSPSAGGQKNGGTQREKIAQGALRILNGGRNG